MPTATPFSPPWVPRLSARLEEALGPGVDEVSVAPLPGGACQDNFRVELRLRGATQRFALRSDAAASLPGSLTRAAEAALIRVATAHGVPTPEVVAVFPDLVRDGATAVLLAWCEGEAIGARVLRAPTAVQQQLIPQLAQALVAIHRVTPADAPTLRLDVPQSAQPGEGGPAPALRFNRRMLDRLPRAQPALELVQRWLGSNAPPRGPLHLVHGDFRLGNFMVSADGLCGVLDWEFAHWGAPAADLGWLSVRDWRFGRVGLPVAGLCGRSDFLAAYADAGGTPPAPVEVHWWEVCGNLRWAVGACYQAERVLCDEASDLELLAIGRRACEMGYEALRLIDAGPE